MGALIGDTGDIAEEVKLGRALLVQGHITTAQKVLLRLCQKQPECAEAFRVLAMVLFKRGDDRRGQSLLEYADELDRQRAFETVTAVDDSFSNAKTLQTRLRSFAELHAADPPEPAPAPPVPLAFPEPMLPAQTLPGPLREPPRRRHAGRIFFLLIVAAGAAAMAFYGLQGRHASPRPSPRDNLDRSLAAGNLEALMRARDVARMDLGADLPDADSLVRLGLVNAFLVADYAVEAKQDAEDALRRAAAATETTRERVALSETARALLALAEGNRAAAKQHAEAAVALPDPPAWALLAMARVRGLAGDVAGASRDLDRAMNTGPDLVPVVVAWAAARLDGGDPVVARRALATLLGKDHENSLARLVLAKAERALGEPDWVRSLDLACRGDTKISRTVRSACAMESAVRARLEGDRAGALRKARAVAQATEDPEILADASLLMASLGDIDAADEILAHARKLADRAAVSLLWADFAVRLGRGEVVRPSGPLEHPAGPERDLAAMRAAYAQNGLAGLALLLKALPPGIQDIDADVRAFAALGHAGGPPKPEVANLERLSEKGNPVASYVLGLLAMRDKDYRLAARRLDKALAMHGDACQAGQIHLAAANRAEHGAVTNRTGLRAIRARNAKCPLPDM